MRTIFAAAIAATLVLSAGVSMADPTVSTDGSTAPAASAEAAPATPATPATPPAPAKPKKGSADEMICKTTNVTGSRLGGTRSCMTRGQWANITRETKDGLDRSTRMQTNPQGS
jgi:hypothetical protein